MDKIKSVFLAKTDSAMEMLRASAVFTFLWGLAAHGYMYLNNSISHDSLDEFFATNDIVVKKIGSARIFVPVVQFFRGGYQHLGCLACLP